MGGGIRELFGGLHPRRERLPPAMQPDQVNIPRIDEKAHKLSEHDDRVSAMYGVDKQHQAPRKAEIPEGGRDDALLDALARNPLQHEAHEKHGLGGKPKGEPD